jgi:protein-S-isoprenylcysteine O-methyltransferase Ste14
MIRASSTRSARVFALAGGVVFVGSLVYFAWCIARRYATAAMPPGGAVWPPVLVDVALFSAFSLHHSFFARTGVKQWLKRRVPPVLERSVYVWIASLLFIVTCAIWQPVPGGLWHITGPPEAVFGALQLAGGLAAVQMARQLDVWQLSGIRQVFAGPDLRAPEFVDRGLYAWVRHPIYTAWMVVVWLPPEMNGTRLVFALTSTLYLALAVPFEERDLVRMFGTDYVGYQRRVRWRMIPGLY